MKQELSALLSQFKPNLMNGDQHWKFYWKIASRWDVITIQDYQGDLYGHSSLRGSFSLRSPSTFEKP
jgi:hypothetical protein